MLNRFYSLTTFQFSGYKDNTLLTKFLFFLSFFDRINRIFIIYKSVNFENYVNYVKKREICRTSDSSDILSGLHHLCAIFPNLSRIVFYYCAMNYLFIVKNRRLK
jgi:hypothetical protein